MWPVERKMSFREVFHKAQLLSVRPIFSVFSCLIWTQSCPLVALVYVGRLDSIYKSNNTWQKKINQQIIICINYWVPSLSWVLCHLLKNPQKQKFTDNCGTRRKEGGDLVPCSALLIVKLFQYSTVHCFGPLVAFLLFLLSEIPEFHLSQNLYPM